MANKKIRFNYFVPYLLDRESPEENIRWDMEEFAEFFMSDESKKISTAVPLGDEIADFERETINIDEKRNGEIYYFQLSKNRSKDIPSKKRLNHGKTPIELDDDEYIGEFTLVVFDKAYNIITIQSNFSGLSIKQIQQTLSILRQRIKEAKGESEEDNPKGIYLRPILDENEIDNVKKHNIYRKIVVKGADYNFAASSKYPNNPLNKAVSELKKVGGVNFTIELSMSRSSKGKSLNKSNVREMVDEVLEANSNDLDVSMNIASKKEEDDAIDMINLIKPRLTSSIVMNIKSRTTISSEAIYNNFCEQNYINSENGVSFRNRASRISGNTSES